jgi:hypothetical protein
MQCYVLHERKAWCIKVIRSKGMETMNVAPAHDSNQPLTLIEPIDADTLEKVCKFIKGQGVDHWIKSAAHIWMKSSFANEDDPNDIGTNAITSAKVSMAPCLASCTAKKVATQRASANPH